MRRTALIVAQLVLTAPAGMGQHTGSSSAQQSNERFTAENADVSGFQERWESESRDIYRARHAIMAELGLMPGQSVADVGSGTGLFTPMLAETVTQAGQVYAVDISTSFLQHIEQKAVELGMTQVETVLCKEDSVELPEASVDLVFLCATYHHFAEPALNLASIHQALKPGGRLVLIDFERIPGTSRPWVLDHVRADKQTVLGEVQEAGFKLEREVEIVELSENYFAAFTRVDRVGG